MDQVEKKLVEGLREGSEAAFKEFVWTYKERFYRIAMGYLKNHEEALDAAQETFAKIYFARGRIKNGMPLSLWSYRVLTNHCIDVLRKRVIRKESSYSWQDERIHSDPSPHNPQDQVIRLKELKNTIRKGMDSLSDLQRSILHLRYFGGLSLKEIARVQGCSIGTVKSSIHRAIKNLRTYFGSMEVL